MIGIDTQRQKIMGVVLLFTVVAMTTQVLLPLIDYQASLERKISGAELKLTRLLELEQQYSMLSSSGIKASEQLSAQLKSRAEHFSIQQTITKNTPRADKSTEVVEITFTRVSLAMFMDYLFSLEQKGLNVTKLTLVPRGGGLADISMTVSR